MPSSTLFSDAMALTRAGDGVYDGVLNEHWTIGEKVHGGAMLALCANAARAEHGGGGVEPIAVSGNFLWAPDPGPMRVVTTVRKRGRRVSLIDVELTQGDRMAVRGAVTLGRAGASRRSAAFGQPGHPADAAGAAARARADRIGPPDGGHRSSRARLRHPAVADHDGAAFGRRPAGHRVLGAAQG
jgi:Thioesterase-like superfamily